LSLYFRFPHQNPVHASPLPIHAKCPAHLVLLDFITRTILGEEYRSWSSSLWSFIYSYVTSSLWQQVTTVIKCPQGLLWPQKDEKYDMSMCQPWFRATFWHPLTGFKFISNLGHVRFVSCRQGDCFHKTTWTVYVYNTGCSVGKNVKTDSVIKRQKL
jgi:hypothetical protein